MSFALKTKHEICRNRSFLARNETAVLYGMLLFGRQFGTDGISLNTENSQTARLCARLLYDVVDIQATVTIREHQIRAQNSCYQITVDDYDDVRTILEFFGRIYPDISVKQKNFSDETTLHALLCGAYLVCGNVTDPAKSYHLEFVLHDREHATLLASLLSQAGIAAKTTTRRSQTVVYTKDSGTLEEFLTMVGAGKAAMEVMNVKIFKGVRNNVNRVTNCETANIEKTIAASSAQCSDIESILQAGGWEALPENLRELARLRLEHPEYSLQELGDALAAPLSRSGVNHRLKRISEIAAELRQSGGSSPV